MRKVLRGSGKFWLLIFFLWGILLSGVVLPWKSTVSPGVVQALRLKKLLQEKRQVASQLRAEVQQLKADADALQSNRVVQMREVRRVLGYAAEDEIIFDFGAGSMMPGSGVN